MTGVTQIKSIGEGSTMVSITSIPLETGYQEVCLGDAFVYDQLKKVKILLESREIDGYCCFQAKLLRVSF